MEEFGVTIADKASTYAAWYDTIVSSGLTGDLIWYVWLPSRCQQCHRMFTCSSSGKPDHISRSGAPRTTDMRCVCYDSQLWAPLLISPAKVYPDDAVYALDTEHAAAIKARY